MDELPIILPHAVPEVNPLDERVRFFPVCNKNDVVFLTFL